MSLAQNILHSLGLPPKQAERALWIIGGNKRDFEHAAELISAVNGRYERERIILSANSHELRLWLKEQFPDCLVWALPWGADMFAGGFLMRGNIRAVLVLEGVSALPKALLNKFNDRAVTILGLGADIEGACEIILDIGKKPHARAKTAWGDKYRLLSIEQAVDLLGEMLGRDLKQRRNQQTSGIRLGILNWLVHHFLSSRFHRFETLAALSQALESPDTILCLGNGPSSEHERVSKVEYGALFRVNHSWKTRGFLTNPHVVFTGGRPSMKAITETVFGVPTKTAEQNLLRARFFSLFARRLEFFNGRELALSLTDFSWGHLRPTNGAVMLAIAAALQPARLVVAGIDLFQHEQGAYPGDNSTPNAFSPAHERDVELAFLLQVFDHYQGELVIIGDILNQAWQSHQAAKNRSF